MALKDFTGLEAGPFVCTGRAVDPGVKNSTWWMVKCKNCGAIEKWRYSRLWAIAENPRGGTKMVCKVCAPTVDTSGTYGSPDRNGGVGPTGLLRRKHIKKVVDSESHITHPEDAVRPKTRGDCENGIRPCPWISCKHNLYLEVTGNGSIQIFHPDLEPDEMKESCVLDIAARGPSTLLTIQSVLNTSRERIRQVQVDAIEKLRVAASQDGAVGVLKEFLSDGREIRKGSENGSQEDDEVAPEVEEEEMVEVPLLELEDSYDFSPVGADR